MKIQDLKTKDKTHFVDMDNQGLRTKKMDQA